MCGVKRVKLGFRLRRILLVSCLLSPALCLPPAAARADSGCGQSGLFAIDNRGDTITVEQRGQGIFLAGVPFSNTFKALVSDWGGGSAHHTFDWFQRTTVLSATPVNTLLSFGLSMDSETEEVAFYVGWRDSGPKGLIVGPNQDTLFRPGDRANSSEAGRDLYLQSGKPGAGGAKGGIWIQESDGKVAFFGATPVVRTSAYTLTNLPAAARTYPAVTPALADLAALVRAILDDLTAYGMFQ